MPILKTISRTAFFFVLWASVSIAQTQIAQANPDKPVPPAKVAAAARKLAQEVHVVPVEAAPFEDGAALRLNLRPLYRSTFVTLARGHERYSDFLGRQVIDGVPFHVEGNVVLYGKFLAERGRGATRINPRLIRGVRVGRAFEELHLLHEAQWPEFEGRSIAIVTLHYRDGSTADLPIQYGVHVAGGAQGPLEENETLTDPGSKIVWRGPGPGSDVFQFVYRLSKSTLHNPQPHQVVDTLDLKSAGEPLASYVLIAATVTSGDPTRILTPASPPAPPRNFDGRIAVRVIDAVTRRPVPNAMITHYLKTDEMPFSLIGPLLLTSAEGEATLRYPTGSTETISLRAETENSASAMIKWQPGTTGVTLELDVGAR